MNILITGASGFLGAETVRLATGRGHVVRAMIRPSSDRSRVDLPDDHVFLGDMADPDCFARAVQGVQGVIHCAATTSEGSPDEALSRRVNVEGTGKLFQAAKAAGVSHFVLISSMSAHPDITSVYARTKLASEEVIKAAGDPPSWTILRPSLIYGPGGKGLVDKTLQIIRKLPIVPVVGQGRELIRPVYVTDVADVALRCLEQSATTHAKTYAVGGGDELSLNDFMRKLVEQSGLKRPLIHLPLWVCWLMAKGLGLVLKNPPLTVDNVEGVKKARRVDQSLVTREIGYEPLGMDEGLQKTFADQS